MYIKILIIGNTLNCDFRPLVSTGELDEAELTELYLSTPSLNQGKSPVTLFASRGDDGITVAASFEVNQLNSIPKKFFSVNRDGGTPARLCVIIRTPPNAPPPLINTTLLTEMARLTYTKDTWHETNIAAPAKLIEARTEAIKARLPRCYYKKKYKRLNLLLFAFNSFVHNILIKKRRCKAVEMHLEADLCENINNKNLIFSKKNSFPTVFDPNS